MSDSSRVVRGLTRTTPIAPGEDRLGHADVAAVLADMAVNEPEGSNIALYGRWGSGKSSVGKALRPALEERDVPFVRYDAFKWAETPLHRHFLLQLARKLDVSDVVDGLYQSESKNRLDLSWDTTRSALKFWGWIIGLTVLVLSAIFFGMEWIIDRVDSDTVKTALAAVVAPTALLGGLGIVISKLIPMTLESATVTHQVEAPSSSEQFEEAFKELVAEALKRHDADRLVVFIDELDRCAPNQVISTLDTIRTFVGVERVVTIVAADREALEAAIDRAIPQETPRDPDHPYYSSGGAVLDKIFSHTVAIPPPLPEALTRFAREIAEAEGGIWADLRDLSRVASVLVPYHVRSPRRVKTLLNAYAVAYTLMVQRMDEGIVRGEPVERELELAKLVCLNVEYPLFARQLADDPELVDVLLELGDERQRDVERDDVLRNRAKDILLGRRAVATDLASSVEDSAEAEAEEEEAEEEEASPVKNGGTSSRARSIAPEVGATDRSDLASAADELLAYLQRTRTVPGPHRDLIHLQALGTTFGLPAGVARRAFRLAQQDASSFTQMVNQLPQEQRDSALLSVASALPQTIGLETDNVVDSILSVVSGWEPEQVRPVADSVSTHLVPELRSRELTSERRSAAIRMVLLSGDQHRNEHVRRLLADFDFTQHRSAALAFVEAACGLVGGELDDLLSSAVAAVILHPEFASEAATTLRVADRDDLIELARPAIERLLAARPAGQEEGEDDLAPILEALQDAIAARGPSADSRALIIAVLAIDEQAVRNAVAVLLPECGKFTSTDALARLRKALHRRYDAATWIDAVGWSALASKQAKRQLSVALAFLWKRAAEKGINENNKQWVDAVGRALEACPLDNMHMSGGGDMVEYVDGQDALDWAPRLTRILDQQGFSGADAVARELVPILVDVFAEAPGNRQQPTVQQFINNHRQRVHDLLPSVRFVSSCDLADDVLTALAGNGDIPEEVRTTYRIHAADPAGSDPAGRVTPAEIASVLDSDLEDAPAALAPWFAQSERTAADVLAALGGLSSGLDRKGMRRVIQQWSENALESEVAKMAVMTAERDLNGWVRMSLVSERIDANTFADELARIVGGDSNLDVRQRAMRLWNEFAADVESARKQLVLEVLVPVMQHAAAGVKGDADLVRRYVRLATSPRLPRGTADTIRDLAENVAAAHPDAKRVLRELKDHKLIKKTFLDTLLGR